MTIDELKQNELIVGKTIETSKLSELKNGVNKTKFKYPGVYILVDKDNEVVYIGSAYARNIRDRLLQYQQTKNTGNSTLYSDLIDGKKCVESNAEEYIKSLTAYGFKDESTEYKLIQACKSAVNIAGK